MRIETSGDYEGRTDPYGDVGYQLGENTRSGAVDGACEFTHEMLENLQRAVEHPDMTPELANLLSTKTVPVEYRVETEIHADGSG